MYLKTTERNKDIEKIEKNTENYLKKRDDLNKTIQLCSSTLYGLLELLPADIDKVFSGHTFPISEAYTDFESSFYNSKYGFYKNSFALLRNVLELGLLSVYWDYDDKSQKNIQNWLKSNEDTPFKKEIGNKLRKIDNIREFDKFYNLVDECNEIWGTLSDYVHTKGLNYSNKSKDTLNKKFNQDLFVKYLKYSKKVVKLIAQTHFLKYPVCLQYTPIYEKFGFNFPAGGFLSPGRRNHLTKIIDNEELLIMKVLSDNDEKAVGKSQYIQDKEDRTEQDLIQQEVEKAKISLRNNISFQEWISRKKEHMEDIPEEEKKFQKKVISKVEKWYNKNF